MPSRAQGESRGYVALEALVSLPRHFGDGQGFLLKQKKPLVWSIGAIGSASDF